MTDLQTAAKIDWLDEFQPALGVSAPSGQPMRCAIEGFALPPPEDTTSSGFKAVMIDSEEKASQLIDTSGSGGFNAFGVEGEFSASWRKEMSYGSRQLTIMLQSWIEWRPQIVVPSSLRLTAEAKKALEKGADKFRRAYGDYFVAGHQRRASFFVMYRLEAHDEKSMSDFKATAKVSGYQAFGEASVALGKAAEEHHVNIDCVRIQQGVSGKGPVAAPLKQEQVLKAYETFVEQAVGTPSTAILYHYSLVDPDVPSAVDVEPEVLVGVKMLFLRLWDCGASVRGVPEAYRPELSDKLARLRADIEAHVPRNLRCDLKTVERLSAQLDDWCSRFAEVQMYAQIWAALKAEVPVLSGNNSADGKTHWKCGITRGTHEAVALTAENRRFPGLVGPAPEVHELYNNRYNIGWHVGHREWKPIVSKPKFRICGYEIIANKSDDGSWSVQGGGLTKDNISFNFYSCYDRGIDWTLRVWGIPADHLAFEGSTPRASAVMLSLAAHKGAARMAPKKTPALPAPRRRAKAA